MPPTRSNDHPDVLIISSDDEESTLVPSIQTSTPGLFVDSGLSPLTEIDDDDDSPSQLPVKHARFSRSSRKFYRESLPAPIRARRKPSMNDPSSPQSETITVNGHVLTPTIVFDTFWRWCAERKSIDDRRRAGEPFP